MRKVNISITSKFVLSAVVFLIAVVRIAMGYVPSSRIVKYGNITAQGNPVSFWITIAVMLLVAAILFILGVIDIMKFRRNK